MKLEAWEREPLWLKLLNPYLKKKRFPRLEGTPNVGQWVRLYAEGCMTANGEEVYADFQLGSENKLLLFFLGGGVSWNAYTAARPVSVYEKNLREGFYIIHTDLFTDINLNKGIFEDCEQNPFRGWSKLVLPYNTGDFHCGAGDFSYIAKDGSERLCHHHGYLNYRRAIETVKGFVPTPEALVVSGCSGGGFGAALLTDDVMTVYPDCGNVTCLVDSAFIPMEEWREVAEKVWKTPNEIASRIHSDNIMLDVLEALHRDRGGRVKILLCASERDAALARMTNYIRHGSFDFSKESGVEFNHWLRGMMSQVQRTIPQVGIYIFHLWDKQNKKMGLTKHCLLGDRELYTYQVDGVSAAEWITRALDGKPESHGLTLLGD